MSEQIVNGILNNILHEFEVAKDLNPIQDKPSDLSENIEKIKKQNEVVNNLKKEIKLKAVPTTEQEETHLKSLKENLTTEIDVLNQLLQEVILKQGATSVAWGNIPLATSLEEDSFSSSILKEQTDCDKILKRKESVNVNISPSQNHRPEELYVRDCLIEDLQQKHEFLKCELAKLRNENKKMIGTKIIPDVGHTVDCYKKNTDVLKNNIKHMTNAINRLQLELNYIQNEQNDENLNNPPELPPSNYDELTKLQIKYSTLLCEYNKKKLDYKIMSEKLNRCPKSSSNIELDMMERKCKELSEEKQEFNHLIKEQSLQIENYREKFLQAQQKVEEQRLRLESMEMNNRQIEDQINIEIKRIKSKFQEKLKELSHFPKLLENEQLKLLEMHREKEILENSIETTICELRQCKQKLKELESSVSSNVDNEKYQTVLCDLEFLRKQLEKSYQEKEELNLQNCELHDELNYLRSETSTIIVRTNERSDANKQIMQITINRLENELAESRASVAVKLDDREDVMKQMQCELSVLVASFEESQNQVLSLKNHICFLNNQHSVKGLCRCGN